MLEELLKNRINGLMLKMTALGKTNYGCPTIELRHLKNHAKPCRFELLDNTAIFYFDVGAFSIMLPATKQRYFDSLVVDCVQSIYFNKKNKLDRQFLYSLMEKNAYVVIS